jgi:hypothetical protein
LRGHTGPKREDGVGALEPWVQGRACASRWRWRPVTWRRTSPSPSGKRSRLKTLIHTASCTGVPRLRSTGTGVLCHLWGPPRRTHACCWSANPRAAMLDWSLHQWAQQPIGPLTRVRIGDAQPVRRLVDPCRTAL